MKYRPSIAFNEFSGTARNVTASTNAGGCYIHTKSQGGRVSSTPQQQQVKAIFAVLQKSWKELTQEQMNLWQNVAQTQAGRSILGQNAQITGINLYLRLNFWIVRCGGTALSEPPLLSGVESPADCIATVTDNSIGLKLNQAPQQSGLQLVILVTAPQSMGTVRGVGRGASCTDPVTAGTTFVNIWDAYTAKYGEPTSGMPKVFFRYFLVNPETGEKSLEKQTVAVYAPYVPPHTVNLTPNDPDYGSVTPSEPTEYQHGSTATISATPASGYLFQQWSDGNNQNPRSIIVNDDITLTAIFAIDQHFTISTESTPTGCGSVTGGGSYLAGQTITLQAIPEEDCYFDHWEDDEWAPPTRQITVESDASYHAIFKRSYMDYSVEISVNKPLLGTTDPEPDTYSVSAGEDMTVYVEPDSDYEATFVGWSDGNTDNPRIIAPTHNTRLQAIFQTDLQASITLETVGPGTVQGGGIYSLGDTITIKAIPESGCIFNEWSDGNTHDTRTIVVSEDLTLTAHFGY